MRQSRSSWEGESSCGIVLKRLPDVVVDFVVIPALCTTAAVFAIEALNPTAVSANPSQSMTYSELSIDAMQRSKAAYNRGDIKTACRELEKADEFQAKSYEVGGIPSAEIARESASQSSQLMALLGC